MILKRIWGQRRLDLKSWAVQRELASPRLSEIEEAAVARPRRGRAVVYEDLAARTPAGLRGQHETSLSLAA